MANKYKEACKSTVRSIETDAAHKQATLSNGQNIEQLANLLLVNSGLDKHESGLNQLHGALAENAKMYLDLSELTYKVLLGNLQDLEHGH